MPQQPEGSVSVDNAWRAAVERAKRGTEALIVTEAQVLELEQQLAAAGAEIERLKREVEQLQEQEGGEHGQDQEQPAAAVGEAVPTHPFSD